MPAYLTRSEALLLLEAFDVSADAADALTDADLDAASDELDELAPFKGDKPTGQARQFPRDLDEEVPAPILRWVALRAYDLAANVAPPIKSTSAGRVSVTYERPKASQVERRLERLIDPYLLQYGTRGYDRAAYPSRVTWRDRV